MRGFVYLMTNKYNSVLYTGVTSDLKERVIQHKAKKHPNSFSARYNICKLVYFESFKTMSDAIKREINAMNTEWVDLSLFPVGI
jgi:putative endonuclease